MNIKNTKLKVLRAFNARVLAGAVEGLVQLKPGSYSFKVTEGEMFQIEISNEKFCYISNKKLEEKIKEQAVTFDSGE
jgi:hypothetical protein